MMSLPVDQLLAALDVGVGAFSLCDIRHGHQLTFTKSPAPSLHYCLTGQGQIRLKGGESIDVRQHTFALIPADVVYSVAANKSDDGSRPHPLSRAPSFFENVPTIQAGDGEIGLITACGEVGTAAVSSPNLFARLDRPLVEYFAAQDGLENHFVALLAEAARPGIGTRAMQEALLKQCLTLLLRRRFEREENVLPWITALSDPGLARAVEAILERSSETFTVETLAHIAGMSRSTFAARFTEALGQPPMLLLTATRLRRARELLIATEKSVADIAQAVGFASRSSFTRAFRTRYSMDPRTFRSGLLNSDQDKGL